MERRAVHTQEGKRAGELEDETRGGNWIVHLDTGERLLLQRDQLHAKGDGSMRLDAPIDRLLAHHAMQTITVNEERISVGVKPHPRGSTVIHITPRTEQRPVRVPLNEEHCEITRHEVNRIVEHAPPVRTEGDDVIVPVVEEVVMVEKRLLLREEIRIHRRRTTRVEDKSVPVRTEVVSIFRRDST